MSAEEPNAIIKALAARHGDAGSGAPMLPIMPSKRLERARERLWRRMMQARREGARYMLIDLESLTLSIAAKVEHFGRDGDENILVYEAHE